MSDLNKQTFKILKEIADEILNRKIPSEIVIYLKETLEILYNFKVKNEGLIFEDGAKDISKENINENINEPRDKWDFPRIEQLGHIIAIVEGYLTKYEKLTEKNNEVEYYSLLKRRQAPKPNKEIAGYNNYTNRQIAIACCVMGIYITKTNADRYLKYSENKSIDKLLQKRIAHASDLTSITQNKTTDTKRKQDLYNAKRLLSGMKKKKAVSDITRIITAFETEYNKHYVK